MPMDLKNEPRANPVIEGGSEPGSAFSPDTGDVPTLNGEGK